MSDVIKDAKQLAGLKVPPLRAEINVHEDEDPRHTDECLVQIIEKDDEYSIWYEEEHGGYEHGKLHFAHVFAAAPELAQALSKEYWMFAVQVYIGKRWIFLGRGHSFNSLEEHACWFTSVDKARAFLAAGYKSNASKYPMKLVRQRRAPVEDWTTNDA